MKWLFHSFTGYAAVGAERTPELGESDFPPIGKNLEQIDFDD